MKTVLIFLIGVVCAIAVHAQNGNLPENVNVSRPVFVLPETARYQIVPILQYGFIAKLDRYTGRTYEYDRGRGRWGLMNVRGGLPPSLNSNPKYQIYDLDSSIFLLNNESGQTWIYLNRVWEPLID